MWVVVAVFHVGKTQGVVVGVAGVGNGFAGVAACLLFAVRAVVFAPDFFAGVVGGGDDGAGGIVVKKGEGFYFSGVGGNGGGDPQ